MTVVTMAWNYRRKYLPAQSQSPQWEQTEGVRVREREAAFHNVRNAHIQFRRMFSWELL